MGLERPLNYVLVAAALAAQLSCGASQRLPEPPVAPALAAPSPAAAPAASAPEVNVQALFDREHEAFPLQPVTDPKGRWQAKMEARVPPTVRIEKGTVVLRADVGTERPLRCEVHDAQLDPGITVANLIGGAKGRIDLEHVAVYRVSAVRDVPVLTLSATYTTKQPRLAGELKISISPRNDYAVFCLHDEPGYKETFARSVESLLESLTTAELQRAPQYAAVWESRVGEVLTGYTWQRIYAEVDGTMFALTFDSFLAQLASGEVRIENQIAAVVHDRAGISKANYMGSVGATRTYELELERDAAGAYAYAGRVDGKDVEGDLAAHGPLRGHYEVLLQLQQHGGSGAPLQFHHEEYRPGAAEQRVVSTDYSLDVKAEVLTVGHDGKNDVWNLANGLPVATRRTEGPNSLVGTVIAQQSSLGPSPGVSFGAKPLPEPPAELALAEQRRGFVTGILVETERAALKPPPAKLLSLVRYRAPLGDNAAYVSPVRRGAKRPAIVWVASGFQGGIGESAWQPAPRENDPSARALREAGLVLMLPALRGSNDNPGKSECLFGEVEDVIAAANYLAAREDVDPDRIYLGGHGRGGTLALLAAATTERFRAVFAFGPVADARQYGTPEEGGCLPSDAPVQEVALRAPVNFVSTIRSPTYVFEGAESGNTNVFDDLREQASERVHFSVIPGKDHLSVLAPGTEIIARAILANQVDDTHLVIQP